MAPIFRLLITAAFFNAVSWILLIPIWQYPDEQAHFAQVQNMAEFGKNPKVGHDTSYEIAYSEKVLQTERDGFGNNSFTYNPQNKLPYAKGKNGPQETSIKALPESTRFELVKTEATRNPPLYYFLASIPYRLAYEGDLFARVYAVRLLSISFFILLILVTYQIAKELFGKSQVLTIAVTSLVAFKPMLVFSSTGVLPDSLTNLLFSFIILVSLLIIKSGLKWQLLLLSLVIVFLGFQTRQQFMIAIPLLLLAVLTYFIRTRSYRKLLTAFLFIGLSPFIFKFFPRILTSPEIGLPNIKLLLSAEFRSSLSWMLHHTYAEVLPWYWGVYKWLSLTIPAINYQIINRSIIIALIGLIIRAILIIRRKKFENLDFYLFFLVGASLIYFFIFAIGDYFFNRLYGYSFGIQGRYFFPLVVAHLAILLVGLWQIFEIVFKKYSLFAVSILVFLMILFNDISLSYVAVSYYDVSSLKTFIEHASHYKPDLLRGSAIYSTLFLNMILQAVYLFTLLRYIKRETKI